MKTCELRERLRGTEVACDESHCVFWAALGPEGEAEPRCALQYFSLLGGEGRELAEWLLSLKEEQVAEVLGQRRVGSHRVMASRTVRPL